MAIAATANPFRLLITSMECKAMCYQNLSNVCDVSVDYDEHIMDGFYDVWGEFNEVLRSKRFPSLKALKRLRLEDGDLREV